jgi:hypothetical protein
MRLRLKQGKIIRPRHLLKLQYSKYRHNYAGSAPAPAKKFAEHCGPPAPQNCL